MSDTGALDESPGHADAVGAEGLSGSVYLDMNQFADTDPDALDPELIDTFRDSLAEDVAVAGDLDDGRWTDLVDGTFTAGDLAVEVVLEDLLPPAAPDVDTGADDAIVEGGEDADTPEAEPASSSDGPFDLSDYLSETDDHPQDDDAPAGASDSASDDDADLGAAEGLDEVGALASLDSDPADTAGIDDLAAGIEDPNDELNDGADYDELTMFEADDEPLDMTYLIDVNDPVGGYEPDNAGPDDDDDF